MNLSENGVSPCLDTKIDLMAIFILHCAEPLHVALLRRRLAGSVQDHDPVSCQTPRKRQTVNDLVREAVIFTCSHG